MTHSWSPKGTFDPMTRTSFFGMALAVYVAAETFSTHDQRYRIFMCILVLASGAYIAHKAARSKSILGLITAAFSLIWILPIFDKTFFYSVDLTFMLAHSAFALLVAVGAFTYLKS